MSAGIKIYNRNKQVLINSDYKNIALRQTIDLSNIEKSEIPLGNRPVVIVEELLSTQQKMAEIALKYDGTYTLLINNANRAKQKIFVFGEPDNSNITSKVGMIVYKRGTNEVAFDSRLNYLQILGDIYHDMPIDPNKSYGIVRRVPIGINWLMQNTGRSKNRYYYTEKRWYEDYGIDSNKVKIFERYITDVNSFFIDRPAPNHDVRYRVNHKPLLVDLTLIKSLE